MAPVFYTVREVAGHYRVSIETVRRWIASGKLPAINIGSRALPKYRIPASSIHARVVESIVVDSDVDVVEFIK